MFENVMKLIASTDNRILVGGTGYLDLAPWSGPTKGIDEHGRPFFSLPLEVKSMNRIGADGEEYTDTRRGMVTFFKRFSDPDSTIWVTGSSHVAGEGARVFDSAVSNPDNGNAEAMMANVVAGDTVVFLWEKDWNGSKQVRTVRMLTASELEAITTTRHAADERVGFNEKVARLF